MFRTRGKYLGKDRCLLLPRLYSRFWNTKHNNRMSKSVSFERFMTIFSPQQSPPLRDKWIAKNNYDILGSLLPLVCQPVWHVQRYCQWQLYDRWKCVFIYKQQNSSLVYFLFIFSFKCIHAILITKLTSLKFNYEEILILKKLNLPPNDSTLVENFNLVYEQN